MKKLLLLLITITIGLQFKAEAQMDSSKIYHKATVAYENGDVKDEVVYFSTSSPFQIQRTLRIAEKDYYNERMDAGKRIQFRKLEKIKPNDVKSVDIHGGPTFVTKKYADLSEIGFNSIPKNYLLYEVIGGDIQLYLLFHESMVVTSDEILNDSTAEEMAKAKLFVNSDLIIVKGDENAKHIDTIKITDFIDDNEQIMEAYENDEYPVVKGSYSSRLKGSSYNQFQGFESLIKLVADYNTAE
ncbi:hypothetical protein [Marivirga sp.]|uniref:hypothetical protein n=1 Tax=Marivirga sp. TaxID=2018662 RepID=UPI0025FFB781|nr:hypothetical protein [Marivirga sp.]